jgi:ribonuclease-3
LGLTPIYELLDEKGPDHAKCFEIAVSVGRQHFPSAWGPSKKEAEQKAAWQALSALGQVDGEDPCDEDFLV